MQKNSVQDLAGRLEVKLKQDQQQIEELTRKELGLHEQSLKELSGAALASMQNVTNRACLSLGESLFGKKTPKGHVGGILPTLKSQETELQGAIEAQTKLLLWMMRVPMLALLIASLLLCAGIWGYWKMETPWETVHSGTKSYKVMKGDWTTCKTPDPVPCQLIN